MLIHDISSKVSYDDYFKAYYTLNHYTNPILKRNKLSLLNTQTSTFPSLANPLIIIMPL